VRAKYRKYSSDEVVIITANADSPGGFDVFDVDVSGYPAAYEDIPAGMHILTSLPNNDEDVFVPEAFVSGSRETLIDVVKAVDKKWGRTMPAVLDDWIKFRDDIAPQSDDAAEYCRAHGLYVPLKVFNFCFYNKLCSHMDRTYFLVMHQSTMTKQLYHEWDKLQAKESVNELRILFNSEGQGEKLLTRRHL
jgi:hypothetical protein